MHDDFSNILWKPMFRYQQRKTPFISSCTSPVQWTLHLHNKILYDAKSWLLWNVTLRWSVVSCRRCGATYRPRPQGPSSVQESVNCCDKICSKLISYAYLQTSTGGPLWLTAVDFAIYFCLSSSLFLKDFSSSVSKLGKRHAMVTEIRLTNTIVL
jgi:hypothetical protein